MAGLANMLGLGGGMPSPEQMAAAGREDAGRLMPGGCRSAGRRTRWRAGGGGLPPTMPGLPPKFPGGPLLPGLGGKPPGLGGFPGLGKKK